MTPISSVIIPVLTYSGTPPDSFGKDGQSCIDTINNILYGPKAAGSWGSGVPIANTADGTANYQTIVWNNTSGLWVANSVLNVDFANNRVGIGTDNPLSELDITSYDASTRINITNRNAVFNAGIQLLAGSVFKGGFLATAFSMGFYGAGGSNAAISLQSNDDIRFQKQSDGADFLLLNGINGDALFTGKIGINTETPSKRFEVIDSSGIQQRLNYSSLIYADLGTNSSGVFTITPTGSIVKISKSDFKISKNATTEKDVITFVCSHSGVDANFDSSAILRLTNYAGTSDLIKLYSDGNGNDYVRLGDNTGGNYTEIQSNGNLRCIGDATYTLDEYGLLLGKKFKGTKIAENIDEGTLDFADSCDINDDYAVINIQLNHNRKHDAAIDVHLHWFQASANMPNWYVEYRYQNNGSAKTTAWTPLAWTSNIFTYSSGTILQITDFGSITPPAGSGVSDILQFRLTRDTSNESGLFAGADGLTGDAAALSFDVHKNCDSLGSDTEYAK